MAKPNPTKAPAFQFYPNDFLGSTKVRLMSTTEVGAYWLLICACWLDGSVPNDMKRLAAITRMKEQPFVKMWNHILHECFIARGDELIQIRLEAERKKQQIFRKQQKDKADKRWQSHGTAKALPIDGTRHAVGNALLSSSSSSSSSTPAYAGEIARARTPIIQKRDLNAAFEGPRVSVPMKSHLKYLRLRNHPNAEKELQEWYLRISDEWYDGRHKDTPTGANMLAFWDARYDEQWPPAASQPASKLPEWAQKAKAQS